MSVICLFIDTNVFLHFRALDQIDWCDLAQARSVQLVFPPVIFRELNKHKDTNPSHLLRKRAKTALALLNWIFGAAPPSVVREGVEAEALTHDPTIDFAAYRLRTELQDDFLLASILDYRLQAPDCDCRLVTADVGLQLKSRAHNIPVLSLSDALRLPEEEEPNAKRVRDLESEVNALKNRAPLLRLCFQDELDIFKVALTKPTPPTAEKIEHAVQEMMKKHPKIQTEKPKPEAADLVRTPRTIREIIERETLYGSTLGYSERLSPEAILKYNDALEAFYSKFRQYILRDRQPFLEWKGRVVELTISIQNRGTLPAEDIDVSIHFPDGFQMFRRGNLPEAPSPPQPPAYPRTQLQMLQDRMQGIQSLAMHRDYLPSPADMIPSNVSSPTITQSHSYDVELHVGKLKHGFREQFEPIYLVFDAFDSAASFHADYILHSANTPQPVTGRLHVVVERRP